MEPPQFTAIVCSVLAIAGLFLTASYEATFTVLSRSSLEKLAENGIRWARLMLPIYEPRHRLRLMGHLGAAWGIAILSFSLFFLF